MNTALAMNSFGLQNLAFLPPLLNNIVASNGFQIPTLIPGNDLTQIVMNSFGADHAGYEHVISRITAKLTSFWDTTTLPATPSSEEKASPSQAPWEYIGAHWSQEPIVANISFRNALGFQQSSDVFSKMIHMASQISSDGDRFVDLIQLTHRAPSLELVHGLLQEGVREVGKDTFATSIFSYVSLRAQDTDPMATNLLSEWAGFSREAEGWWRWKRQGNLDIVPMETVTHALSIFRQYAKPEGIG